MSPHKVIVGVDNSAGSRAALRWAAEEAARAGRRLLVINAYEWHVAGARFQVAGGALDAVREVAEQTVASAVDEAEQIEPDVEVLGEAVVGNPGRVLVDASNPDDLVVVGHRGRGGFASLVLGSVGRQVATRAKGPAVVVRGGSVNRRAPVVVGVDTAHGDHALRLAFEQANARGTSVRAVHAYLPPEAVVAYGVLPAAEDEVQRQVEERALLEEAIAPWAEKYPEVPVEIAAVVGHPVEVLEGLSETAQLVVVGHRNGGLGDLYLGSVASGLLHHAHCSVLIAHGPEATAA